MNGESAYAAAQSQFLLLMVLALADLLPAERREKLNAILRGYILNLATVAAPELPDPQEQQRYRDLLSGFLQAAIAEQELPAAEVARRFPRWPT